MKLGLPLRDIRPLLFDDLALSVGLSSFALLLGLGLLACAAAGLVARAAHRARSHESGTPADRPLRPLAPLEFTLIAADSPFQVLDPLLQLLDLSSVVCGGERCFAFVIFRGLFDGRRLPDDALELRKLRLDDIERLLAGDAYHAFGIFRVDVGQILSQRILARHRPDKFRLTPRAVGQTHLPLKLDVDDDGLVSGAFEPEEVSVVFLAEFFTPLVHRELGDQGHPLEIHRLVIADAGRNDVGMPLSEIIGQRVDAQLHGQNDRLGNDKLGRRRDHIITRAQQRHVVPRGQHGDGHQLLFVALAERPFVVGLFHVQHVGHLVGVHDVRQLVAFPDQEFVDLVRCERFLDAAPGLESDRVRIPHVVEESHGQQAQQDQSHHQFLNVLLERVDVLELHGCHLARRALWA